VAALAECRVAASSFDDVIRAEQERGRYRQTERLGRFQVDEKLKFCGLFNREITWFCALENPMHVLRGSSHEIREAGAIVE